MGGLVVKVDDKIVFLKPKQLLDLLEADVLSWPDVTEQEILDRSKADWVLKSLALIQASWFIAQVIGRAAQGLSVTTLELFTLGIISCALVTYAAWWAKPFDVRTPTIVEPKKPLPGDVEPVERVNFTGRGIALVDVGKQVLIWGACATIVFGALHLVGWRFHFPTEIELWLWRASSITCVAMPMVLMILLNLNEDTFGYWFLVGTLLGLYVLCRLYMVVEMFINLRAVPADVYRVPQWSQYFPSFG